jgi:uncharacterized membrane protein
MERMLVVVFDSETKAYDGAEALVQLDADRRITLFAYAVLAKHADGTASVKLGNHTPPVGTLLGTSLGALIGILGGPAGVAFGTAAGLALGAAADLGNARVGDDFVKDVERALSPNTIALAAEIEEELTTPVDTRMEAIGGTVFRRALSKVTETAYEEQLAAMEADLAQLKEEAAKASADRLSKFQERIQQLESKIQALLQEVKDRRQGAERQAEAKAKILKSKVETARANLS